MTKKTKFDRKAGLLGGVAVALTAMVGLAQSAEAQTAQPQAAASNDDETEIVVTAERRSEALSDTPIAATVLNADMLSEHGVNSILDLQNVAPATVLNVYNRSTFVNIRGIGLATTGPNVVQGVPFYMNGAYIAYDSTIRGSFYDIESVEVLRGPQGTLTGLNSTGGAVYIRSRAPELGIWSGSIDQTFSEYNGSRTVLAGNIPIGEHAALRLAGNSTEQDSFTHNLGNANSQPGDTNEYGVRADFMLEPTDGIRINLRGEYYRSDTDWNAMKRRDDPNPNPFEIAEDANSSSVINNTHLDLEVNWDVTDDYAVRFQSSFAEAYQVDMNDRNRAVGGASNNLALTRIDPTSFANEINFISTGSGKLQWVLGAMQIDQSNRLLLIRYANCCSPIPAPGDNLQADVDIDYSSVAVFGQASYQFNDLWELTVGARYSADDQTWRRHAGTIVGSFTTTNFSSETPTYRVVLNYTPSPDTLIYGSVSRGYKQGGVNLVATSPPFEPETNLVAELGWKQSLFDHHLQLNSDIFLSNFSDAQFQAVAGAPPAPVTANAPSVQSYGAELELLGNFGDLNFNLGVAYLNAEFDEAASLTDPGTNLLTVVPAGRRMTFSPEWTLNAGIQYDIHVGHGILTPRLQYAYVDSQFATPFPDGPTVARHNSFVPSHSVLDARLTYHPTDAFGIEVFVNNITDETYIASQIQNASSQTGGYIYGAPRVAGLRLTYALNE